jgi:hypothetical protein
VVLCVLALKGRGIAHRGGIQERECVFHGLRSRDAAAGMVRREKSEIWSLPPEDDGVFLTHASSS